jgi:hypothetical protein
MRRVSRATPAAMDLNYPALFKWAIKKSKVGAGGWPIWSSFAGASAPSPIICCPLGRSFENEKSEAL